jgi:lycopene cyclase domain-containing protein
MEHFDYLKWFLVFAWTPTLLVWLFFWRLLSGYWKVLLLCCVGSIIFGYPWDYWATHSWLWKFSSEHTLNKYFFGLPLEEYIFFISETLLYGSIALVLRDKFIKRK